VLIRSLRLASERQLAVAADAAKQEPLPSLWCVPILFIQALALLSCAVVALTRFWFVLAGMPSRTRVTGRVLCPSQRLPRLPSRRLLSLSTSSGYSSTEARQR
jgi:hypothetical protein